MSRADREEAVRRLADHGIRAFAEEDWTYQGALDALRENRRRHAQDPRTHAVSAWGAGLAHEVVRSTGLAPDSIAAVLLYASSWAGGLALMQGLSRDAVLSVLACAADDLDQQAKAGEPS